MPDLPVVVWILVGWIVAALLVALGWALRARLAEQRSVIVFTLPEPDAETVAAIRRQLERLRAKELVR